MTFLKGVLTPGIACVSWRWFLLLGEGQEIDWIGHTEYSETRIEQLDHIFNLIGILLSHGRYPHYHHATAFHF